MSLVFLAAALSLAVTPGTGTLYVVARTLAGGWRDGLASVAGTTSGGLVHAITAAVAGAALVGRGAATVVSAAGAGYLLYIGVRGLRGHGTTAEPPPSRRRAFLDGLLLALLNPSTAVFLLAFLPRFVDRTQPALTAML